jgi:hypothetical protein
MYAKKTLVFAAAVATASATCPTQVQLPANPVVQPDGSNTPTIGVPFLITYDGTGLGPLLDFELLRGPGTALVSLGLIASGVSNCGTSSCTYSWTPACGLEPDTTHYGIKMIDEATCMFQYTTQFGLNAGTCASSSAPPPASSSSGLPPPPPPSSKPSGSGHPTPSGSGYPTYPSGTAECEDQTVTAWTSVYKPKPTGGYVPTNGTATSVAGGVVPSPTYTPVQVQSNDASRLTFGAVGALVALVAVMLL